MILNIRVEGKDLWDCIRKIVKAYYAEEILGNQEIIISESMGFSLTDK